MLQINPIYVWTRKRYTIAFSRHIQKHSVSSNDTQVHPKTDSTKVNINKVLTKCVVLIDVLYVGRLTTSFGKKLGWSHDIVFFLETNLYQKILHFMWFVI